MTRSVSERALAKVNLTLAVGPPKANGRHDLDSLVVFARDVFDTVTCRDAPPGSFSLRVAGGAQDRLGPHADNLCIRAAERLSSAAGSAHGAEITLEKRIPIAAGLGGGSADAAATLRALTALWGVTASLASEIAPELGGDVPVALRSRASRMRGEGEDVSPAQLGEPLHAVLANPGAASPTAAVFAKFDRQLASGEVAHDLSAPRPCQNTIETKSLALGVNSLQPAAIATVPAIADVLQSLELAGASLARVTGSGATCFGLFPSAAAAREAAVRLQSNAPEAWWVRATALW